MTVAVSNVNQRNSEPVESVLTKGTIRSYRRRGFSNLLRMGHCAPAVMQTLNDIDNTQEEWLVRMTAGLPGGVGNTGFECGGISSPLIKMGLKYGLSSKTGGLPSVIYEGHDYQKRFCNCNNSLLCRDILGKRRVPMPCIKVVRHAPELYSQTTYNEQALSAETKESFLMAYSHMAANDFHCAHAVIKHIGDSIPVTSELLDATSGFIGGTVFNGLTCSAFAAGVMAVGLKLGEIENSHLRVMKMLTIMVAGGNAFSDDLNKFNRLMNTGHRMSEWFREEFGSTLCSEIVKCDFSSKVDVQKYIKDDTIGNCKIIAEKVASHAGKIISRQGDKF